MQVTSPRKVTYVTILADPTIHPRYEEALREVEKDFGKHHPMYINGKQVRAGEGEFEHRSPVDTSIVIGYFQKGTGLHARKAIAAATEAFKEWGSMDWRKRVAIIRKVADVMSQRQFYLAALITYEVGKNRTEAIAEVNEAVDMFRYYADQMEKNEGYIVPMETVAPGEKSKSVLRPYGAWAVISPFNFPIALAAGMITGALITGNTVVYKPTSEAPLTGLHLYKTLVEGGVPEGVINFVTGPGGPFGAEVAKNPDVAGIAFTGSKDVGMTLYQDFVKSQAYPKPFIAELGSKNPAIVTSKADLSKAAKGVVRSAFGYSGQKCSATSRVYVERGVKNDFLKFLKEEVSQVKVGDPREKGVFVGPVINQKSVRTWQHSLEQAKKEGAKVVAEKELEEKLPKGYYVKPVVVTGLRENNKLVKNELFVPFVVLEEYKTLDEALEKANDTDFGLTAGIFSEDPEEVRLFFENIKFGVTYANREGGATTGAWPGAQPFGGWKGSGMTGKGVGGPYYLLGFMHEQAQTVVGEK